MDIVNLAIQLLSGALGGHAGGAIARSLSLGGFGNSIAGMVGGGLGSQILVSLLGFASQAASGVGGEPDVGDMGHIVAQVAGAGLGGGLMVMIVGVLRQIFEPVQAAR